MKFFLTFLSLSLSSFADVWTDHFSFENIPVPAGIDPQIGALATLPDQRIVIAFHRGEVMIYDPVKKNWSLFAEGLHEPLGLLVEDAQNILVMQRPELTRLTDTDDDGIADHYTTVFDDFGMTGNYHEFAFGPVKDAEGHLYIALGVASNGAGIRPEIRGKWNPIGAPREKMLSDNDWKKNREAAGRMYGRVPWRGWVIKISPEGKGTPYACGLRSPNGMSIDQQGRLLVCDNQGDWVGTSTIHHIRKDHFYGHPASLIWREGWTADPLKMAPEELDVIRTPAAGLLPQSELANSPTQPITIPQENFPSIEGQTLIGEMNQKTLIRFVPDSGIQSTTQGVTIPFLNTPALGKGNNRLTFTADGALWIGKTHLSWPGDEGLIRITKKEQRPLFLLQKVTLSPDGFHLHFNEKLPDDASKKFNFAVTRHTYHYHQTYGSKKIDEQKVIIKNQALQSDGKTYFIATDDLKEGYLYNFEFKGLTSATGRAVMGDRAYYHLISKAPPLSHPIPEPPALR